MESTKPASERLAPSADAMAVDPSYAGPVLPPAPPAGSPPVPASALMADEALPNEHGISLGAWRRAWCRRGVLCCADAASSGRPLAAHTFSRRFAALRPQPLLARGAAFVKQLAAWQKAQKHLHKKYALQLLLRLNALLRGYRSLVTVPFPPAPEPASADGGDSSPETSPGGGDVRFNVCGDTHGQYYDTLNIFGACTGA
jgi:hypothetical protein